MSTIKYSHNARLISTYVLAKTWASPPARDFQACGFPCANGLTLGLEPLDTS
jgi:hypothetical protein